jgi:hypothetical protein
MLDRDTTHILDNFSRREIYSLYKGYVEGVEGNGNFITYTYFTRLCKKQFNNVCIHKKSKMGILVYVLLLNQEINLKGQKNVCIYYFFLFFFFLNWIVINFENI